MQTKTSIGMSAAPTNTRRGVNRSLSRCLLFCVLFLTSCERHLIIDLLNESGGQIRVVDEIRGEKKIKLVSDNDRALVHGTGPLIIIVEGKQREYRFQSFPAETIQSKFTGRVVSLALGHDGRLYVLKPDGKAPIERMNPQPQPFPIDATLP